MQRTTAQQKWFKHWKRETTDKLRAMGIPCCLAHEQTLNEACCQMEKVLAQIAEHLDSEDQRL